VKAIAPSALASVFNALKRRVPEVQAFFLVRDDGELVDRAAPRSGLDADVFAHEYLPLLQIVRRASEDMGVGGVAEHIVVSDSAVVVAGRIPGNHYSIVVSSPGAHLGRLRHEIRRMTWDIECCLRVREPAGIS
jgi:predicted regulator of Ras-like GTPase activity (Roadblock/LC7/MglB family)